MSVYIRTTFEPFKVIEVEDAEYRGLLEAGLIFAVEGQAPIPRAVFTPEQESALTAYRQAIPTEVSAALNSAIVGLSLVKTTDPDVPTEVPIENSEYLSVRVDNRWVFISGTRVDGTEEIRVAQIGDDTYYSEPLDDLTYVVRDAAGYVTDLALDRSGEIPSRILANWWARKTTRRNSIICRGDSLTAGAMGAGTSYPQLLANATGLPVFKRGFPGESGTMVAMRQGSIPLTVTVPSGSIPASGPVAVTVNGGINLETEGPQGTPDSMALVGQLNGIRGTLTESGGVYTFTRTYPGAAYATVGPTLWVDEWETEHRDSNQIVWVGRNGYTDTPAIMAAIEAITRYQTAGDSLVMGITTNQSETTGTSANTTIIETNQKLAMLYKHRFLDIRAEIMANGLALAGITPTAADTTAIANGTMPPSLVAADGGHFTADGYRAVALIVRAKISTLGWL